MIVDNLLKKGRPESGRPWFVGAVETFQETSLQRGYEIGAYAIRGVCDTPLRDYFLMKVFVATPSSVVTRKKYMPLARPLTLMRVGMGE